MCKIGDFSLERARHSKRERETPEENLRDTWMNLAKCQQGISSGHRAYFVDPFKTPLWTLSKPVSPETQATNGHFQNYQK